MRRRRNSTQGQGASGEDSFLDIVANMVGILIILVMVVGVRAQGQLDEAEETPQVASVPPPPELVEARRNVLSNSAEMLRMAGEVDRMRVTRAARTAERDRLARLVSLQKVEMQQRKQVLDQGRQEEFELNQQIEGVTQQIERLKQQLDARSQPRTETVEIASYSTPISKTIEGNEAHFQLKAGRVVPIPVDQLLNELKDEVRNQAWKLRDRPEVTDTVGPIGGFRMRYTLVRVQVPPQVNSSGVRGGGTLIQLDQWTLVPTSSQIGETLDEAYQQQSAFRAAVGRVNPRQSSITIWVYPDSFAEFRALRKDLYESGYSVAGRPLPEGVPIAGSPDGSKSAAQ